MSAVSHLASSAEADYCRWATDDPNPEAIKSEAKRIEVLGTEAIKGMLDEGLVEAAQTIRALEDGDEEDFYPIEQSVPSPPAEVGNKRGRDEDEGGGRGKGQLLLVEVAVVEDWGC